MRCALQTLSLVLCLALTVTARAEPERIPEDRDRGGRTSTDSPQPCAAPSIDNALVLRLKPTVVNVERSCSIGLGGDHAGLFRATGFVVDARRGLIATNRHVTGQSPAVYKIVFHNGQSTEARLRYYDPWHDFGFLQVDPKALDFPLTEAPLGESTGLREQDDVLLIGNNEGNEYSVKFGKLANLHLSKGDRHSATLQTTFDRTKGTSGSPVFDPQGRVVALHFAGTDTTSFELRAEYLRDALAQLQQDRTPRRGDAGLDLRLLLLSDAARHFHLPAELRQRIAALRPGLKHVIAIDARVPTLAAAEALLPGDILLQVDGQWVGDDLYLLDRLIDQKAGGEVTLEVARAGVRRSVRLKVQPAEDLKIRRFIRFAGGVLHDLTPELRLEYNFEARGVFLAQIDRGSTMDAAVSEVRPNQTAAVIEAVNSTPTTDLASFIAAVRPLRDGDALYILLRDRGRQRSELRAFPLRLGLRFSPLQVSRWDDKTRDWVVSAP